jgi:competence protein ComEC
LASIGILDVGHGNCAVVQSEDGCAVVDTPSRSALVEYLMANDIKEVNWVFISHTDEDHVGGLYNLLASEEFKVGTVYINPDPIKQTHAWRRLLYAIAVARTKSHTQFIPSLGTTMPGTVSFGDVTLKVLAPSPARQLAGVGGQALGVTQSANNLSAVISVECGGSPEVLLTGDLDAPGLDALLDDLANPRASVLVFPHHGGRPKGDPYQFARRLCDAFQPKIVLFSIGRGQYGTPLPDIIRGVRASVPSAHIACTQLSQHCASIVPSESPRHLRNQPASGRRHNACCIGTLELNLSNGAYQPSRDSHRTFVMNNAPSALCLVRFN